MIILTVFFMLAAAAGAAAGLLKENKRIKNAGLIVSFAGTVCMSVSLVVWMLLRDNTSSPFIWVSFVFICVISFITYLIHIFDGTGK